MKLYSSNVPILIRTFLSSKMNITVSHSTPVNSYDQCPLNIQEFANREGYQQNSQGGQGVNSGVRPVTNVVLVNQPNINRQEYAFPNGKVPGALMIVAAIVNVILYVSHSIVSYYSV